MVVFLVGGSFWRPGNHDDPSPATIRSSVKVRPKLQPIISKSPIFHRIVIENCSPPPPRNLFPSSFPPSSSAAVTSIWKRGFQLLLKTMVIAHIFSYVENIDEENLKKKNENLVFMMYSLLSSDNQGWAECQKWVRYWPPDWMNSKFDKVKCTKWNHYSKPRHNFSFQEWNLMKKIKEELFWSLFSLWQQQNGWWWMQNTSLMTSHVVQKISETEQSWLSKLFDHEH